MSYVLRYQLLLLAVVLPLAARAQTSPSVGIGTTTPDASAALEIKAADKGLLPPRLTAAQRAAISSPATGLLVFQTDGTSGYYYYTGTAWLNLGTGTSPGPDGRLPVPATYGFVTTLAGTGSAGGLDGPAATARFTYPGGVAVDAQGRVYVADYGNNRIRLVENGQVTTLVGTAGYGNVDGSLAVARFSQPSGIAVDAQGRVYVADTGNNTIRLIENGQVTTLAGSGSPGNADGPATVAQFLLPSGVAVDARGRVYVADYGNHRIRLIENGQVTTLAGSGSPGNADGAAAAATFNYLRSVAVDGQGRVYVADADNHTIRLIENGQVTTLAGSGSPGSADGPAAVAQFSEPSGVAVDGQGRVYVADYGNHRIRLIENGRVTTLAGSGSLGNTDGAAAVAQFRLPLGIAVDGQGTVYVGEIGNRLIRRVGGATTALPLLTLSGQSLSISGGNSVTLPTTPAQTLAVSGQSLSISGGNTVTLPSPVAPAPQTLSLSGQSLSISGGNTVTLPSPAAPLTQQLMLTGTLPAVASTSSYLAHSLDPAKIVGIMAVVSSSTGDQLPPGFTTFTGSYYSVYVVGQQVRIDVSGSSANVLGRPIRVLLIYQP